MYKNEEKAYLRELHVEDIICDKRYWESIETLTLPSRAVRALQKSEDPVIRNVLDLMCVSQEQLLGIKGFSEGSMLHLHNALFEKGLRVGLLVGLSDIVREARALGPEPYRVIPPLSGRYITVHIDLGEDFEKVVKAGIIGAQTTVTELERGAYELQERVQNHMRERIAKKFGRE